MLDSYETDSKPRKFLEHLIMRCHTENFSRNHFPVVLESSNSAFWSHDIFMELGLMYYHFPALDLYRWARMTQPDHRAVPHILLQQDRRDRHDRRAQQRVPV